MASTHGLSKIVKQNIETSKIVKLSSKNYYRHTNKVFNSVTSLYYCLMCLPLNVLVATPAVTGW